MKRVIYSYSEPIKAATKYDLPKDDMEWIKGLFWDIDGHMITITGVNGYPLYSCELTEEWISEDTGKDCKTKEFYAIKIDDNGSIYLQNKKHPRIKKYLNSAFNYDSKVLDDFTTEVMEDYDYDDEEDYYTPSASRHDYSPSDPWNAPGMSIHDFI